MSNIPHIISKVLRQPWAITEERHNAILQALEAKLGGGFERVDGMGEGDDEERCEYREFQTASGGVVAVIPIHGIVGKHLSSLEMACGGCSLDAVQSQLKTVIASPRITGVILDISSPGGTVTGTPETADLVRKCAAAKKTWAFTDSECCSAAMWIGSQASKLYSTESATLGSIGVRIVLLDETEAIDAAGIKVNAISSGKYKLLGASFKPLEPEERAMLQADCDDIWDDFKEAVSSVRSVDPQYMEGQCFGGEEAAGIGMTDGLVECLDDVLEMLSMPAGS